jgi:hypothetical protein
MQTNGKHLKKNEKVFLLQKMKEKFKCSDIFWIKFGLVMMMMKVTIKAEWSI